jgi:transglutaminase-like putative cysteine protease
MCLSARQDRDWAGEWLVLDDDNTPDAASSDSAISTGLPRSKRAAIAASSVIVIDDEEVDPAPAPIPVYQPPPRGVDIDAFFRERATDLQARGLASQCIAPSVSLTARRRKHVQATNRLPPPPSVLARQAFVEANKRTVIKNGRVVVRAPRKSTAKAASASSTLTGPAVGVDPDAGKKWLIRTVYGVSLPRLTALDVQSPAALAVALCRSAGAERTVDRAELCFKWVAVNVRYDMVEFRRRSRTPGSQDPDVVLRDRKGVCVGYAQLFAEMCAFVQVECTTVCGDCITSDGGGPHMWNAVKLANHWCVCDPCWASGHRGEDGSFNSCLDMNWWCTTPDLFIKTHLPDAQKWQLLDKPISKADFQRYKR